jgi:hypothetical protein
MAQKKNYIQTNAPHIAWIDLHNNKVMQEIAIMKEDESNGDIYYIAISDLDQIDKVRLLGILKKPNTAKMPLWEAMSNETLKNGINALVFFHQLTKIRTTHGKILTVGSGQRGAGGIGNFTNQPSVASQDEAEVEVEPTQQPKANKAKKAE